MFLRLLLPLLALFILAGGQNYQYPPSYNYGQPSGLSSTGIPTDDDTCVIRKEWTGQQKCQYVIENQDNCEGGGYLLWSRYVTCSHNVAAKIFIILGAVTLLLVLFLHISTAADEFFSPNIAAIVAHLRISESIAGVTFMAFGNGAPDIFGSIASILSTPKPKADLALGALLGAGLFVTTCVLGTIISYSKPFRVHKFGLIRDLIFYLIAVSWILFVFLRGDTVLLYEPLVYLGIYVLYLAVVIVGSMLLNKYKRRQVHVQGSRRSRLSSKVRHRSSRRRSHHSSRHASTKRAESLSAVTFPEPGVFTIESLDLDKVSELKFADDVEDQTQNTESESYSAGEEDDEDPPESEDVIVLHNHVYDREDAPLGEEDELPPTFSKSWKWSDIPKDLAIHLNPWPSTDDWNESGTVARFMYILRVPTQVVLRATIPRHEDGWSKPVILFYCLIAPQFLLFAIHMLTTSPFHGSPGLYVYGFAISAILILLIILFTRMDTPPRYHKEIACYTGFVLAVAWIYLTASEIVNIITMVGVMSGLSFEILGMTILAWSNSLGDMIADLAVVKQGYPRMAMAAATGGPLFNLLMGFGLSFTIAKAKGTIIEVSFSSALHFVVIFLFASLVTSLIAIFVFRFRSSKYHAMALFLSYGVFFVLVILCEAKVIKWT